MGVIHTDDLFALPELSQLTHQRNVFVRIDREPRRARVNVPHRHDARHFASSSDEQSATLEGAVALRVFNHLASHLRRKNERGTGRLAAGGHDAILRGLALLTRGTPPVACFAGASKRIRDPVGVLERPFVGQLPQECPKGFCDVVRVVGADALPHRRGAGRETGHFAEGVAGDVRTRGRNCSIGRIHQCRGEHLREMADVGDRAVVHIGVEPFHPSTKVADERFEPDAGFR